ncbi:adenosylmethionine mitochondrial carrier protein [Seminavis robusta]|uniref:Adenosylmethionine mitochondrial carrier protein n=1 Tax=Seminavis robusta TaxID=568900 RepID=A0A9N8HPN7_9STRA|nr:adenosylmethionine mitochondrial carrier protein [Seminavis robusta]|eukprot:Sro915_g219750.1 adenosylmethionine mitochondrial carrier protein (396) ;mRNA; r:32166-33353
MAFSSPFGVKKYERHLELPMATISRDHNEPPKVSLVSPARGTREDGQLISRSAFLSSSLMAVMAVSTTGLSAQPSPANAQSSSTAETDTILPKLDSSVETKTNDKKKSTSSSNTLEESISGFIAGASLATTKTIVKYPLDTATVRLQMPRSDYSINQPGRLLQGSFRGVTTPLLCNIPAGAVFFAVKDATKEFLKTSSSQPLPRWASTSIAVLAATVPYMLVRNPSEVIKTRQQAGVEGYGEGVSALQAFENVKNDGNSSTLANFYLGYWENVLYTYPADVIKFVSYENFSGGRKNLPPLEGAVYGAMATATAQFLTTPLDVIRNRVMAGTTDGNETKSSYVESLTRIAQEEGLAGLFAGVSPRVGKALLSGAIQFATYEETKQTLASYFQRQKR